MKVILPLKQRINTSIALSPEIKLPYKFVDDDNVTITFDIFSAEDKKLLTPQLFNYIELIEYMNSRYKILIERKETNIDIESLCQNVDLISRVVLGIGFSLIINSSRELEPWGSKFSLPKEVLSRRSGLIFNEDAFKRFASLFSAKKTASQDHSIHLSFIHELMKLAMGNTNKELDRGVSGGFFVTILESLFLGNDKDELRYKFSIRIAKAEGKDLSEQKYLKKLYDKRSTMFHSGKNDFSIKDLTELESKCCWAIEKYMSEPDFFFQENLDSLLLS